MGTKAVSARSVAEELSGVWAECKRLNVDHGAALDALVAGLPTDVVLDGIRECAAAKLPGAEVGHRRYFSLLRKRFAPEPG